MNRLNPLSRTRRTTRWARAWLHVLCVYFGVVWGASLLQAQNVIPISIGEFRNLRPNALSWETDGPLYQVEGTVTHFRPEESAHFVQDETGGVYFLYSDGLATLTPGDQVVVTGFARPGALNPILQVMDSTIRGQGLPTPDPIALDESAFENGRSIDANYISVSGYPRQIQVYQTDSAPIYEIKMGWNGFRLEARVSGIDSIETARALRGALVEFHGVAAIKNPEETGVHLSIFTVNSTGVRVLKTRDQVREESDWTPISRLFDERASNERPVRVRGLFAARKDQTISIVDNESGLYVDFEVPPPLMLPGTQVECFGFRRPSVQSGVRLGALEPLKVLDPPDGLDLGRVTVELDTSQDFDRPEYHNRRIKVRAIFLNHKLVDGDATAPSVWVFRRNDNVFSLQSPAHAGLNAPLDPFARYELRGVWDRETQTVYAGHVSDINHLRKPPLEPSQEFALLSGLTGISVLALVTTILFARRLSGSEKKLKHANQQLEERFRKDSESIKKLSAEQLTALESSDDGVVICGNEGRIRNYNENFKKLWSIQVDVGAVARCEELSNGIAAQLKNPQQFRDQIQRMRENPSAQCWDTLTLKDGRIVELTSMPQFLDGDPVGRVWRFHDVTGREQERTRLKAILDSATEGIICSDDQDRILLMNPAAAKLLGVVAEDALGTHLGRYLNPQANGETNGLHCFESAPMGIVHRHGDSSIPVEVTRASTDYPGGLLHTYLVRDIRERLERERQERESERKRKQAEKLSAVGLLAGGVAHDFNNVVGSMLLNAKFLRKKVANDAELSETVDDIIESGEQGKELVTQVLTFSRQDEAKKTEIELESIVGAVAHELRNRFPDTIAIRTEGLENRFPVVANATQLRQLFTNLGQNAAQAISKGVGTVLFRVGMESGATDRCVVAVQDNGSGMDEETRRRIFDPFFTTKPVGKGVGLGLAVVHGIVASHNGEIEVHSKPGKGTTFFVRLPIAQKHSQ